MHPEAVTGQVLQPQGGQAGGISGLEHGQALVKLQFHERGRVFRGQGEADPVKLKISDSGRSGCRQTDLPQGLGNLSEAERSIPAVSICPGLEP